MTYTIQFSNTGKTPLTIVDGTTNLDTSISLVGRNVSNYGQKIAENFLHILENFSNITAPNFPIEGQLWYDVSQPNNKILKIYDGSNWVPTDGVYQTSQEPTTVKVGDIWVDTASSQLKIWNGTQWLLIGPSSSAGTKNGIYPTVLIDNIGEGLPHDVIITYINGDVITIVSKETFTPRVTIPGFNQLVPGLNVSTFKFGNTTAVLSGLANTALNLKLSSSVNPISADHFLRNDVPGTLTGFLNVDGNSGIRIGSVKQTVTLERQGNNAVLSNRTSGANIALSVVNGSILNEILTVDGNNLRIGINQSVPTTELDVTGSGHFTGSLSVGGSIAVTDTTQSSDSMTGSLVTAGGLGVGKNVSIDGDTTLNGKLHINSTITGPAIIPSTASTYDIGSSDYPFRRVYAGDFVTNAVAFSMVPTGTILLYATGGAPPTGFLICNGSSQERALYPRLFGVISTTYGATDDTHFNIPKLDGYPTTNPNVSAFVYYIIKY